MTFRDEAALFIVKGVTDGELGLADITVCWEVRGLSLHLNVINITAICTSKSLLVVLVKDMAE